MELTERQTEIIEKAVELIATRDVQNLTIKNLAKAIGFTEPAVYRHFESKKDILATIIRCFDERMREIHEEIEHRSLAGIDKLDAFFAMRFHYFTTHPTWAKVLMNESNFSMEEELAGMMLAMMKQHRVFIRGALQEASESKQLRNDIAFDHIFMITVGALRLLVTRWILEGNRFDLVEEGHSLIQSLRTLLKS